ncbi:DUF7002 family protein [Paenibacillus sp. GCM10023250]|uniref:DUF7002 family protein n=1 Tax=Paenibacillus sp. GCM10023250 TaxID=3252648 RepID=UPI003618C64C
MFHFTRADNLPAIAHADALRSSLTITGDDSGIRRPSAVTSHEDGRAVTVNAHLRISPAMMAPGWSVERFRACLDRHVFFWPTRRDCLAMLETYARREPGGRFAVLELDAASLLAANQDAAKLSKYDSGSSPRFPKRCGYLKSPAMLLPLAAFGTPSDAPVPAKPSEVKEVLVEGAVREVSRHLRRLYVKDAADAPDRWAGLAASLDDFAADAPVRRS